MTGRYNVTDNDQQLEFCDGDRTDAMFNTGCGDRVAVYSERVLNKIRFLI